LTSIFATVNGVCTGFVTDSICETPVTSPDFYPTILEMAGLPQIPSQHIDGLSITDLFGGRTIPERAIYWHYPHYGNQGGTPGCSIRMGDYKLIEFFEDGRLELYNLRAGIREETNIVNENKGIAEKMHGMLKKWQVEVWAKFPEVNPDYSEWQ